MQRRRILTLVRKELIQALRDKRLQRMTVMGSLMQLLMFGYGVSTDVNRISTAVYDEDRTAESRRLIDLFIRSGYFHYDHHVTSPRQADRLLDLGRAQVVLHVPLGFSEDLARGRTAHLQALLDGSDSMTAGIIAGYVNGVVRSYSEGVVVDRLERARGKVISVPGVEGRVRVWYNPELKSIRFLVPGVISAILLVTSMMMTALAIVKERELGTLEQLIVTPIRPLELMLGKTVPFLLLGLRDMTLVLLLAVFWFGVKPVGSLVLLYSLSLVFLATSLGLGLLISTVSKTMQEATLTSFFFMMPSMLLSGFMFPIENMPQPVQWLTYLIPLRYFLVIIRGIFLKGSGLELLWPQVAALTLFAVVIIGLAAFRFTKRIG